MKILQVGGLDAELYPLIGPMVMNPKILKANNNYPFKTAGNYQWYIAIDADKEVIGFLPVENKRNGAVINNYYLHEDSGELLALLFNAIGEKEKPITAIVLVRHKEIFSNLGFQTEHLWTNYIKMTYNTKPHEEKQP